ncbi:MAG: 1-acyl-sn-glycerol-3-phosphate acyltransferase [Brevefilum sp.]|nr:1-acyl-sn-glycerol-3-phosphate acyltransferase [Brevefilum sp.]
MTEKPLFSIVFFLIKKLTKFQVLNAELIPPEGGLLMTTNHISRLDVPMLMAMSDRTDLVAIVANKYEKKPFFKWVLEKIGTIIWMDREKIDFSALREVLSVLRRGEVIGIAPEGTRSHGAVGLLEGKQGAAVMAAQASVPILPVGIIGTDKIYEHWMKLRRPPVTIRAGKPYYLPEMDPNDRQAWLSDNTDEIMCRIAALLPPEYRGFYADHPRLKELLAEEAE